MPHALSLALTLALAFTPTRCAAWAAPAASRTQVQVGGADYVVRSMGDCSYFAAERERIQQEARQELRGLAESKVSSGRGGARAAPPGKVRATVIVLRHGYSEYNARNIFTGWADPELSNRGREEARRAGSVLRESGVRRIERVGIYSETCVISTQLDV